MKKQTTLLSLANAQLTRQQSAGKGPPSKEKPPDPPSTKRPPKEKPPSDPPDKGRPPKEKPPADPPDKGRPPKEKHPPVRPDKDKEPREEPPIDHEPWMPCFPPEWYYLPEQPLDLEVDIYLDWGYDGESTLDLAEAGVWVASLSVVTNAICILDGENNNGCASFGLAAGGFSWLLASDDLEGVRSANIVAGAAAVLFALLNVSMNR